ncbi:MAG: hypothetical protein ACI4O9_08100 [Akkermansia sp.]
MIVLNQNLIDLAHTKFATKWEEDWQQAKALITGFTSPIDGAQGKYMRFPRIGGTEVREYTSNDEDVHFDSLKHGNYGIKPRKFHNEIPLNDDDTDDTFDLDYTLGTIRNAQYKAAERFMDMVALGVVRDSDTGLYRVKTSDDPGNGGGILGNSYEGENGEKAHALDLSYSGYNAGTGNLVPIDYATTGTGVSELLAGTLVDRMKYVVRRLAENDAFNSVDPSEICLCISPAIAQVLGSLEMSINRDYAIGDLGDIARPVYNRAIGATIIQTNMLPTMDTENKGGTAIKGARMCCAWLKSQIGFGRWKSTEFRIKDVNNKVAVDYYLRVKGKAGCGRKRDDAVFVLPVLES